MITWHQSKKNENLFRCVWDNRILLGYVVKSAAPLIPDMKVYAYWASDGTMFTGLAKAQQYVADKACSYTLD